MKYAHRKAIESMIGSGMVSNSPVDQARAVVIINAATFMGDRAYGLRAVMNARALHRAWVTRQQRYWQTKVSRRPGRSRHADSLAIREKYVRA